MEANFADFYRVSGLRGVYLASQLADGVTEDSLRPSNLTTVISFNSGATWQPVQGPKTDHEGNPVLGCYQVSTSFLLWIIPLLNLQWAKCPPKSSGADCDLKKIIPVGKVFWMWVIVDYIVSGHTHAHKYYNSLCPFLHLHNGPSLMPRLITCCSFNIARSSWK